MLQNQEQQKPSKENLKSPFSRETTWKTA